MENGPENGSEGANMVLFIVAGAVILLLLLGAAAFWLFLE
jgi:flagellar basal body-associated protein FliL